MPVCLAGIFNDTCNLHTCSFFPEQSQMFLLRTYDMLMVAVHGVIVSSGSHTVASRPKSTQRCSHSSSDAAV